MASNDLPILHPTALSGFLHAGSRDLTVYHIAGAAVAAGAAVTASVAVNTLVAFPITFPRGGIIDRMGFRVTTAGAAGSVARIGLYDSHWPSNIYPWRLLKDSGEFATTTTGQDREATVQITVIPNMLYWLAYTCGTAAPTLSGIRSTEMVPIVGASSLSAAPGVGLIALHTYSALPGRFPPGASAYTSTAPRLMCRLRA